MAGSNVRMLFQIKKNSQKQVVIVPINVHHRHDSQVSQILNPDKASDVLQKLSKRTSKVKKRQPSVCEITEPGKKICLQSTSDSSSVVHHQEDENLLADDSLNSSLEFVELPCKHINATRKKRQLSVREITEPEKSFT
ncbi:hypothetical protein TNCT_241351 [Trichonephila clavata]|uniref:Uncharacterized protein n=1 Tax=Trichonephila clavata TaxID=2740835 RepID=A0A8X6J9N4_TRICU|nr:hypothetical protein TNCT_241351 [Trichonephila clavata]